MSTPQPGAPGLQPLLSREDNRGSVASTYGALYSSPHPGIVSGIVLACIAGYILIIWIIYTVLNIGPPADGDTVSTYLGGESVITRNTAPAGRRGPRPVRVRERVEVRRRESSRRVPEIVESETAETESDVFMGGGRSAGRGVRTVTSISDDEDEDDEIIVEEEHRRPRRGSRRYHDEESAGSSAFYEGRRGYRGGSRERRSGRY